MKKTLLSNPTQLLFIIICLCVSGLSFGQTTTLFQFDFEGSTNPNINNTAGTPILVQAGVNNLQYVNSNVCGTGVSTGLSGNSWNANDFYRITVNTTGFSNMNFSYCNSTANVNINNFDIRYSVDNGVTISPIAPSYVPTLAGATNSVALPPAANNQSSILIYIYKTNNSTDPNVFFRLDNITLTGTPVPQISSFTPNTACSVSGATVVITGSNFTNATAVRFNGIAAASFTVNSNTQITAQLPTVVTTGALSITTASGTGTSTTNFTATAPPGDQVSYGNSAWIGYVYAVTDGANPPTNAFTTNYIGNITQTETFDLNLGTGAISGPNLCNSYADNFAIRFKMNKVMPAGNYVFNVGGDDGYRLSLDGGATFIVNDYLNHGYQSTNYSVFLSGSTNFVLEYFESTGSSRVQFSYTLCPANAGIISGNQYLCTYNPNQTTTFSSTVSGGTWSSSATGVATVNPATGVVTGVGAGTATITYNIGGGTTGCPAFTAKRDVFVASSPGVAAVISGSQNQCQSSTANYTISPVAASFSYIWSYSGTGATITPAADGLSASIVYSSTATSGNILVRSANACGSNTGGNERFVTVGALPTAASISGATSVCTGAAQPNVVFGNPQNYGVTVNYNINGGAVQSIYINANTSSSVAVPTGVAGSFTYNLVSVANGVGVPACSSSVSGSAVVIVNTNSVSIASSSPSLCKGSAIGSITHTTIGSTGIGTPSGLPAGLAASWSSNLITISGTPTVAGTFSYSIPLTGGCGNISAIGTIVVNATAVVSLTKIDKSCSTLNNGSISGSLSSGLTSIRYIKLTQKYNSWQQVAEMQAIEIFSGANVALASAGATATSSSNYVNNAATYGPQRAIDGVTNGNTFWHSNSTNINEFITVDLSSGKNLDYIRIYNRSDCCQDRGQNMLLELFDSSNTVVYSKTVNLWGGINGPNFIDVNVLDVAWADGATSLNRSGLSTGTYTLNSSDANGCSASTSTTIGTTAITTSYNGLTSTWSPFLPGVGITATITSSGTINADVNLCSCTVNPGVTATVAAGVTMRLQNELTVSGSGSITFKDTSSLVQINNAAVNTGSITYERQTTPISRFDYTYYCSPVSGQTLFALSPNTLFDKFYSFDSTADNYRPESSGNTMGLGVGYIVRGPQSFGTSSPTGTYIAPFKGVPYNGALTTPIGPAGKSNLIGNPYPSALDANLFLEANTGVLEGTIYFWTHNTSIRLASNLPSGTAGSGVLAYTSDDYAAYNRSGGVATASPSPSSNPTTGVPAPVKSNAPTGKIASGQSFFGTSVAPGNANFNNNMRVGFSGIVAGSNADFFKFSSTKKSNSTVERNRIWLDLTNTEGAFKETLLGYISGATNDNESAFDGESFDGNEYIDFYSINNDKNLTIQGRALPFNESEVVPLGYTSTIAGVFGINIRDKDGLFVSQNVFLEDKLLGTEFDLSKGIYNFSTETGTFNNRFAIRYTSKTLGIEDVAVVENGIYISNKNKQIKVSSAVSLIDKVQIYDLAGKLIYLKTRINSNEAVVNNLPSTHQVLIVKVTLIDGSIVSKKLIF